MKKTPLTHNFLSNNQTNDLIVLMLHIDNQLKKAICTKREKVTVILLCEVPDDKVLFIIGAVYRKQGWNEITISPRTKEFYKEKCYWAIQFMKSTKNTPTK